MTSIAIVVRGSEQVEKFIASTDISGWDVLFAVQTRRTVALGDEIVALGHTGVVETMNSRSVVIRTVVRSTCPMSNCWKAQWPTTRSAPNVATVAHAGV